MNKQLPITTSGGQQIGTGRKPDSSTAVRYASDLRIFFKWVNGKTPASISIHDVDEFIEWQQRLGMAPATIRRRLIPLTLISFVIALMFGEAQRDVTFGILDPKQVQTSLFCDVPKQVSNIANGVFILDLLHSSYRNPDCQMTSCL